MKVKCDHEKDYEANQQQRFRSNSLNTPWKDMHSKHQELNCWECRLQCTWLVQRCRRRLCSWS